MALVWSGLPGVVAAPAAFAAPQAPLQQIFDGPNGAVEAMAVGADGTAYLGGSFTAWGPQTGGGAVLDPVSAAADRSFPPVQGKVFAAASDGAGGWYIGGYFQAVAGVKRRNLAHILPDGQLDPAWNPRPNSDVSRIAVSPDGSVIYVSGQFTQMCGAGSSCGNTQTRTYLAAVNSDGSLAAWNPSPDADVLGMAVSPDGTSVYVGGNFSNMCVETSSCTSGEQSRTRLAAVSSGGDLLPWNPAPSDGRGGTWVRSVATSPDGTTVYVGGNFSKVDGLTRSRIAAITNGVVSSFDPQVTGGYPDVQSLVVSPNGQTVYLGGDFTAIGGQPRSYAGAVNATTGAPTSWNPNPDSKVWGMTVLDDTVYLAGEFTSVCGVASSCGASQTRRYLAGFGSDGDVASWNPNVDRTGWEVAASATAIYVGGYFTTFSSTPRSRLAAVDSAGDLTPWSPEADSTVLSLAVHGSTVIAGGVFTMINGEPRTRLAAIDAGDGTQVSPWAPNANDWVRSMALVDDSLYVAGDFSSIAGQSRGYAAAFDLTGPSGPALAAWNPGFDGPVTDLAATAAHVYAAGAFTTVQDQSRTGFASVSSDGTGTPTPWSPQITSDFEWNTPSAYAVATSAGTDVYIGGDFDNVGSDRRGYAAAFSGGSSVANAWDPGFNWVVYDLAVAGTTVYAAGSFTSVAGGTPRNYIAGLNADGSPTPFNPSANDTVRRISVTATTAYLAGDFTAIDSTVNGATYSPYFAMTSLLEPQATLTVDPVTAPVPVDDTRALTASGGSGSGAVTFSSGTSTGCSVTGSTLSVTSVGSCAVTATRASDGRYLSQASAPLSISLTRGSQAALTVQAVSPATVGSQQTLTTTGGSGSGAVTYSAGASTACSVSGAILTIGPSTGTCTVTATKAQSRDYLAATSAPATIVVEAVPPNPNPNPFPSPTPTPDPTPSPDPDPQAPSAPREVRAVASAARVSITWEAPVTPGDVPITHYQVRSVLAGGSCIVLAPSLTCEVSGLQRGVTYRFVARARSAVGWSVDSEPSNPVILDLARISISGKREGRYVSVTGSVAGATQSLRAMWRTSASAPWRPSRGWIQVRADGTFRWSRAVARKPIVWVYVTDGEARSTTLRLKR